jgi:hypothetical protein
MKNELNISIKNETLVEITKRAQAAGCSVEELAARILEETLEKAETTASKPSLPVVAMIKNGFSAIVEAEPGKPPQMLVNDKTIISNPFVSTEKLQRKKDIEARMRELSMLIETAENAKKEGYLLQYAILAAELEAII